MRIRTISAIVAIGLLGAFPANAAAQARGEIGGPPSLGDPLMKRNGPTSEAIVIGTGIGPLGRVEIVAQNSKAGLCVVVDHPDRFFSAESPCGTFGLLPTIAVSQEVFIGGKPRSRSTSSYAGFMQPTIASVIGVAAQRKKGTKRVRRKSVTGIAAVPGPEILSRLHQAEPFGFFTVEFRGCLEDAKVRAVGLDPSGMLVGSDRAFRPSSSKSIGGMRFRACAPGSFSGEFRPGGF